MGDKNPNKLKKKKKTVGKVTAQPAIATEIASVNKPKKWTEICCRLYVQEGYGITLHS